MNCPDCGGPTKVSDSARDSKRVYRRRECKNCGKKIYTTELVVEGSKYLLSRLRNR